MATLTQFLKLYKPAANEIGWDDNINADLDILDSFVRQFMNVPGFVGAWTNATAYVVGQVTLDPSNGSFYKCSVAHTSAATNTFAADRTARPSLWVLSNNIVQDSATQAANSATAAQTSANSAAASATSSSNSLTAFQDTYYGALATDPIVDPHGHAPTAGDLYFNTTSHLLRVYSGTAWLQINPTPVGEAPAGGLVYGRQGSSASWVQVIPATGGVFSGNVIVSPGNLGAGAAIPVDASPGQFFTSINVGVSNLSQNLYAAAGGGATPWRYYVAAPGFITAVQVLPNGVKRTNFFMGAQSDLATVGGQANLTNIANYDAAGNYEIFGNAAKAVAGPWIALSDERIKNVIGPYPAGLTELLEMLPKMYTYKGNDNAVEADGSMGQVLHPDTTTVYVGLIAQECEPYMPELVTQTSAYIDGVLQNDVRVYDPNAVTYALVNAVAELAAKNTVDTPFSVKSATNQLDIAVLDGDTAELVTSDTGTETLGIYITSGPTAGSTRATGGVWIQSGPVAAGTDQASGDSGAGTGDTGGAADTGAFYIYSGTAANGSSGDIIIGPGLANGAGNKVGDVKLVSQPGAGGAANGHILLSGAPTADPHVVDALWIDAAAGFVVKVSQG